MLIIKSGNDIRSWITRFINKQFEVQNMAKQVFNVKLAYENAFRFMHLLFALTFSKHIHLNKSNKDKIYTYE